MTGVRTASVQVVATATLAALVGGGGLGRIINLGFGQQNYSVMIAGALLVAVLSLLTEVLLVLATAALTPGPRRWTLPRPWRRQQGQQEPQASAVPL
jgi:osmoprotectant transport system permease protein